MIFIDTHTHLYLNHFDNDRSEVVQRAIDKGIEILLLPCIDADSFIEIKKMAAQFPQHCYPMIGLHPTSVKMNFETELERIDDLLKNNSCVAIGECGMDLYWDKTFKNQQEVALLQHLKWAEMFNLPIVIHSRESLKEILSVLKSAQLSHVKGVFHCYPGDVKTAKEIIEMGFMLGIGGVLTYKNASLVKVIEAIGIEHLLLETDAPFLPPVPYRGQRNESAYLTYVAQKIADILHIPLYEVAQKTTQNAFKVFPKINEPYS